MTDEQINEAITQATGLWDYPYSSETKRMYDFCSDLNAMHEAEKTLSETNMFVMAHYIERFVSRHGQHYFHATAHQRAEAFLRTLFLWKTDHSSERAEMEVQK
jgi:hypothetical protein